MKTLILILAVACAGCATPRSGIAEATDSATSIRAGSKSSSDKDDWAINTAASYLGDANNISPKIGANRDSTNSGSGALQQGFTMTGVANAEKALSNAIAKNPVIKSFVAEMESKDITPERLDVVRASLIAEMERVRVAIVKAGGDLSSLTTLVVVNIMGDQMAGAEPKATDTETAKAAAENISKIIQATTAHLKKKDGE